MYIYVSAKYICNMLFIRLRYAEYLYNRSEKFVVMYEVEHW